MREIKFRAFENGKMYHSDNHGDARLLGAKLGQSLIGTFFNIFYAHETLGQFTGLKDKNGKDIYEGDICLILYTDWPSNSSDMPLDDYIRSISHKGIIEYHDFSYYIMIKNRYDELSKNSLDYGKHGRIEVIGNIHEHSHLLK